jgi:hypothetical protein
MNHKKSKSNSTECENTQDQPGVEDGKQKHHTGLPGVSKSGKMQVKKKSEKEAHRPGTTERDIKRRSIAKNSNTPPAHWHVQS